MSIITAYRLADCATCGRFDTREFVVPPTDRACKGCGTTLAVIPFRTRYTAHVPYTARKRFTPHWNRSLGEFVESPEHLKHLQGVHGCQDADLARHDSDGWSADTPRDFERQARDAQKIAAAAQAASDAAQDAVTDDLPTEEYTWLGEGPAPWSAEARTA